MKVIDLLNKIANGEEVPKKIKTNNRIYHYCSSCDTYEDEKEEDIVVPIDKYCLNDTVEIIEEQQDIDIQSIEEIKVGKSVSDKINELVQAVKQLDKKIK